MAYWLSHPPTSVDSVSFPSLNAPAPPHPDKRGHGSQWTHSSPRVAGHLRWLMSGPLSSMRMFSLFFSVSSMAENIPAGPAPTIITSYFKECILLKPRSKCNNLHIFLASKLMLKSGLCLRSVLLLYVGHEAEKLQGLFAVIFELMPFVRGNENDVASANLFFSFFADCESFAF